MLLYVYVCDLPQSQGNSYSFIAIVTSQPYYLCLLVVRVGEDTNNGRATHQRYHLMIYHETPMGLALGDIHQLST
jgi:hypothetical protein